MTTTPSPPPTSPSWGSTTKLVVGLTLVAIVAALVIQFRDFLGPLILAFILAFLLHPLAQRLSTATRLSWRASVNLIYFFLIILLIGLIAVAGVVTVQQVESLIGVVRRFIEELPNLIESLSTQVIQFGPFVFDLGQLNLEDLAQQLLSALQNLLGEIGGLVSSFATSALTSLGWTLFILLISYFLLSDSGRVSNEIVRIDIPGYNTDIRRLGEELRLIWDAFLRGQLIIVILVIIFYIMLMMILGVRYALGIAILAGLSRFVPYVGPLVTVIVVGLVAFFQGSNYYGLAPLHYAIVVIVATVVLDQIFDNLVVPRFLGEALGVHPAAVLVAALVLANLIGIVGLILAAPVLATLSLLGRYVVRKLFDLDPWTIEREPVARMVFPWMAIFERLRSLWRTVRKR